jgi:arginyl-tRNA synthetase
MSSENPFDQFRQECEETLRVTLKKLFPEIQTTNLTFEKPPNIDLGQIASPLCFELAKQTGKKPFELANRLAKAIDKAVFSTIDHVSTAGSGYLNFHANFAKLSALTISSILSFKTNYGYVKTKTPLKIIVEHTSANPLHPLHIGTARNPLLGDALATLFTLRGHSVSRHFYIDDVGRQSSVIAYGYDKLGRPRPEGKTDHFIGKIYTITSCLVEINRLEKELKKSMKFTGDEKTDKITKNLDEWTSIAAELKQRHPSLFRELSEEINRDENPEIHINELNRAYELKEENAKELSRTVSELCLEGFKQTLNRIGVSIDSWDWESELVWNGDVAKVFEKLKKSQYVYAEAGVMEFDAEKASKEKNLKAKLKLRQDQAIPPLTLVRSDGTTLYTTRDIAYTLWKFEQADMVVNVIGTDQNLAQLQLKIALYALGYTKFADNLIHFAYNLVALPGVKMSSRRGQYVTLDEVMDEATKRAYEEVSKRSPELPEEERRNIADFVGIGAVRFALVGVDPTKPVVFTWDKVLNFETNSAPYIQYTHARACSILRKADNKFEKPNYALLNEKLEREIILILASFPDTFNNAADSLKPNLITEYSNALADKFNTFYNALPVLKAESQELRDARLALTDGVRIVLRNALNIVGVLAPEKM